MGGTTQSLLSCMKSLAEEEGMWRGRQESTAGTSGSVFMHAYCITINWAVRNLVLHNRCQNAPHKSR